AAAARQQDADALFLAFAGQGSEKEVDRQGHVVLDDGTVNELAVEQFETVGRGRDIDPAGLDGYAVARFFDRHGRVLGEDVGQQVEIVDAAVGDNDIGQVLARRA